jgi:hypothetical protein
MLLVILVIPILSLQITKIMMCTLRDFHILLGHLKAFQIISEIIQKSL